MLRSKSDCFSSDSPRAGAASVGAAGSQSCPVNLSQDEAGNPPPFTKDAVANLEKMLEERDGLIEDLRKQIEVQETQNYSSGCEGSLRERGQLAFRQLEDVDAILDENIHLTERLHHTSVDAEAARSSLQEKERELARLNDLVESKEWEVTGLKKESDNLRTREDNTRRRLELLQQRIGALEEECAQREMTKSGHSLADSDARRQVEFFKIKEAQLQYELDLELQKSARHQEAEIVLKAEVERLRDQLTSIEAGAFVVAQAQLSRPQSLKQLDLSGVDGGCHTSPLPSLRQEIIQAASSRSEAVTPVSERETEAVEEEEPLDIPTEKFPSCPPDAKLSHESQEMTSKNSSGSNPLASSQKDTAAVLEEEAVEANGFLQRVMDIIESTGIPQKRVLMESGHCRLPVPLWERSIHSTSGSFPPQSIRSCPPLDGKQENALLDSVGGSTASRQLAAIVEEKAALDGGSQAKQMAKKRTQSAPRVAFSRSLEVPKSTPARPSRPRSATPSTVLMQRMECARAKSHSLERQMQRLNESRQESERRLQSAIEGERRRYRSLQRQARAAEVQISQRFGDLQMAQNRINDLEESNRSLSKKTAMLEFRCLQQRKQIEGLRSTNKNCVSELDKRDEKIKEQHRLYNQRLLRFRQRSPANSSVPTGARSVQSSPQQSAPSSCSLSCSPPPPPRSRFLLPPPQPSCKKAEEDDSTTTPVRSSQSAVEALETSTTVARFVSEGQSEPPTPRDDKIQLEVPVMAPRIVKLLPSASTKTLPAAEEERPLPCLLKSASLTSFHDHKTSEFGRGGVAGDQQSNRWCAEMTFADQVGARAMPPTPVFSSVGPSCPQANLATPKVVTGSISPLRVYHPISREQPSIIPPTVSRVQVLPPTFSYKAPATPPVLRAPICTSPDRFVSLLPPRFLPASRSLPHPSRTQPHLQPQLPPRISSVRVSPREVKSLEPPVVQELSHRPLSHQVSPIFTADAGVRKSITLGQVGSVPRVPYTLMTPPPPQPVPFQAASPQLVRSPSVVKPLSGLQPSIVMTMPDVGAQMRPWNVLAPHSQIGPTTWRL